MPLMKITQMMFEKKKISSLNESTEIQKKKKVSLKFYMVYGKRIQEFIWKALVFTCLVMNHGGCVVLGLKWLGNVKSLEIWAC